MNGCLLLRLFLDHRGEEQGGGVQDTERKPGGERKCHTVGHLFSFF